MFSLRPQGGGWSPSNVSRRGLAEFARAAHVRRGVAAGPSDVCREGLRSLGACLQGGAVFGGSFFKLCFCFQSVVFSGSTKKGSPRAPHGRCSNWPSASWGLYIEKTKETKMFVVGF